MRCLSTGSASSSTSSIDGAKRQPLTTDPAWTPAFSPDGKRIAFFGAGRSLHVVDANTSQLIWSTLLPRSDSRWLRWSDDGKSLLVSYWSGNVWRYPLQGTPKQLTHFDDVIWSFDVLPDGAMIVSRGTVTRDAVLITGFR